MRKNYLKILLLALFLCGLSVSEINASGSVNVSTFADLQTQFGLANTTGSPSTIVVNGPISVTADFNMTSSYPVTINVATTSAPITITAGTLTIGNNVTIAEGIASAITVNSGGNLVVNAGSITNGSNPTILATGGNVTITGGTISTTGTGNPTNLKITNGSIVRISSGIVQNTSSSTSPNIITIDNTTGTGGKLYITGGTIQTSSSGGTAIYLNSSSAQLWISGSPVIYGKTYGISAVAGSRISLATTTATITGVTTGIKTIAGTVINNYSKSTPITPGVASGAYTSTQSVSLSGGTDLITQYTGAVSDTYSNIINGVTTGGTTVSASLLYTTNGNDPITSPISSTYSSAISIPVSTTLKVAPYILPSSTTVGVVSTFTYYIAPVFTTNYPAFNLQTTSGFTAKVNINEPGKAYYVVLPSGATAPTPAQIKAGQNATGTSLAANLIGSIICTSASTDYTSNITGLTAGTTYDVYFIAEDLSGNALQASFTKVITNTNAASSVADPVSVSSAVVSQSQINIAFTPNANSNNVLIAWNTTNTFGNPVDGTGYNSGDALSGGGTILYNGGTSPFSHISLTPGTIYYYKVWSVNGSSLYSSGMFANATTYAAEPTTQATSITFSAVTLTGMTISWTGGNGSNRIVLVKAGSSVDSNPVDGTVYTANSNFGTVGTQIGTGNYVVYNSTGNSVAITGLSGGTVYNVAVYEYNGTIGTYNYLTSTTCIASQSTIMNAPAAPTALTFSSVFGNSFKASFTAPGTAPTGYLVLRRIGAAVTGTPISGTSYTLNQTNIGSGINQVVYVGSSAWNGYDQLSLTDNALYYYAVYSYNGSDILTNYSTPALTGFQATSAIAAPTSNAATNVSSTGFTASWSAVSGASGYLLDVNTTSFFPLTENFERCLLTDVGISNTTINNYLQTTGWSTTSNAYQTGGSLRLGYTDPNTIGDIITPQLNLSGNGGNATLSFDCQIYVNTAVGFRVYHAADGVTWVPISGTDTITPSTWTTKTYSITGGTSLSKIKIVNPYGGHRFLIDNFRISQINNVSGYDNLSVSGTSQDVSGLTLGTNYFYRVRAVGATNGAASVYSGIVSETPLNQTITFGSLSSVTYGNAPITVSATGGGSGNPVTFTSSDPTVATCTGTNGVTVTMLKAGSCTIYANQNGITNYYNAAPQVSQTLTVNPKALTVASAAATSKVYDGNNSAVITGTLTGKVGSDVVTLTGTGTFNDAIVGTGKAVTSTSTLGGAAAGNYSLTQPTGLTANMTAKPLTVTSPAVVSKVYDGNNAAVVTGTLTGKVGSDDVTLTGTGTFNDATVGTGKAVTSTSILGGAQAGNYSLTQPTGLTGTISPATFTSSSTGNLSTSALTDTQLANTDLVVSSGELVINQSPSTIHSITVNPGAKLTLNTGQTLTTPVLNLNSDINGTATYLDNGTTAVTTANVQQYLGSARNWYMTSPISGATVPTGQTYYSYDETGSNTGFNAPATAYWVASPAGSAINSGWGYIAQPSGITTNVFTGTLNTGDKTVTLTRTTAASKPGFNLVGNPYPSYLDWSKVAPANPNVLSTAWFRTKKGDGTYTFATVNVATPATPVIVDNGANTTITKYIPPMQAYWVRVVDTQSSTSYTVTNSMRDHADNSGNTMKARSQNQQQMLRLQVSNGINSDDAIVYFNPNAQNTFDNYDSPKMSNNSAAIPEIYTIAVAGTEQLVINGLNSIASDEELPLGFTTGQTNTFSIKATEISNFDAGTSIVLRDRVLNTEQDITDGSAYSFTSDPTTANTSRFSLVFKAPSATTGLNTGNTDKNISVYRNANNQITINYTGSLSSESMVTVSNAVGQKLVEKNMTSTVSVIDNRLLPGVYLVSVTTAGKSITKKVILN